MSKKLSVPKYPINLKINNKKPKIFIIVLVILIILWLVIGPEGIIAFIGLFVAFLVISHILTKLSAAFITHSKISVKPDPNFKPFVSIHIACKNESAEIVNKTIEATTKLDYPSYEVIVIHNNNLDFQNWRKIKKYIQSCGKNYKFIHLDKMTGFKAGSLNYLDSHYLNKKTEIEAFVDCDYIVTPDFLNKTVGYFKNPEVGIVQAPQNYYNINPNNTGLAYEYRSFFALIMHQSQRLKLVTFTGTMGLIRADLMREGLKWDENCITEDVEVGVHINSLGLKGIYIDENLGKGLMPFDYVSLIKQRQRWAYGNMQVIKKDFFTVILNKALSTKQKFDFFAQLVTWFHLELVIAVIYLGSNIIESFSYTSKNIVQITDLMLILLMVSLIGNLLYFLIGLRKEASLLNRFKAFLSHYGLLYVMSSSWIICLLGQKLGFIVTKKEKHSNKIPFRQYSHEFTIILILLIGLWITIISHAKTQLDIPIISTFIIIELMGIFYLYRSFIKSNRLSN